MSLHLLAECDGGCGSSTKLINKTLNEAPEGWVQVTLNSVQLHACSKSCAEKAVVKEVNKLFFSTSRPAPRSG